MLLVAVLWPEETVFHRGGGRNVIANRFPSEYFCFPQSTSYHEYPTGIIVMLLLLGHRAKHGDFQTKQAPSDMGEPQDTEALSLVLHSS